MQKKEKTQHENESSVGGGLHQLVHMHVVFIFA